RSSTWLLSWDTASPHVDVGMLRRCYRGRPGDPHRYLRCSDRPAPRGPAVVVVGRGEVELGEDRRAVLADRLVRDEQALRDRAVRAAFGHEGEDLALTGGQTGDGLVAGAPAE